MLSREESVLPIVDLQDDDEMEWEEESDIEEEDGEQEIDDEDDEYEEYEDEFADEDEPRRKRRHAEWE